MNKEERQSAILLNNERIRSACFNRMMQYSAPVSNVSSSDYVTGNIGNVGNIGNISNIGKMGNIGDMGNIRNIGNM